MIVRISRSLLDRIVALAGAEDAEICGLLLGKGAECTGIVPAANVAQDPAVHFEIDPAVLIAAHRAARGGGSAVIGHYHSHPSGAAEPSATDAAAARPDGALWLIVAGGGCRLWRAGEEGLHGRFSPEIMELI
ncbi:M67 family metallopeptidase [Sphingobium phenoxybenzoativorans]|uniref:M67 family metallopeptidase n=1 Tax=Sphingobium phenoxybenzoativorans TaxID=1592790 RepID=A0A975K654_9SPHN|nr:M67 family metallopeptidase [Sphingobium phenoxybenzoativorans]QUT04207.1 M67 family metallopeptidase [Sphingobium phenoxybenzoativorans]